MRSPKRIYSASHVAEGVKTVARIQLATLAAHPDSAGPLANVRPQAPTGPHPPAELHEAHCHSCKEKKAFVSEGNEKMANGAIRHYGTGACGHRVSTFVSGAKSA